MLVTDRPTLFAKFKVSGGMLRIKFAAPTPPFFHYYSNTHLLIQYMPSVTPYLLLIEFNYQQQQPRNFEKAGECLETGAGYNGLCLELEGSNDSNPISAWSASLEESRSSKVVQGSWDQGELESKFLLTKFQQWIIQRTAKAVLCACQ